jgi:predicted NBD/HSP70 family sugar kinase
MTQIRGLWRSPAEGEGHGDADMSARPFAFSPALAAPLDPAFTPCALWNRAYVQSVRDAGTAVPLIIALEGENGRVSRYETVIAAEPDAAGLRYAERLVKTLLWARGGWRVVIGGPPAVAVHVRQAYAADGARAFDADMMQRIYLQPFTVESVVAEAVPAAAERGMALGGHLDGCRIGFDLGASDFKLAAVREGEVVWAHEIPWDPKNQSDPEYHYAHLRAGLQEAASHLPRVDAIGGSSAGVIVNNRFMVASLLRSVSADKYGDARNLFVRLQREWNIPLEVANDGDVTALAGAMSLGENGVLGIALGSSEAVGYIDPQGRITGWLNELAFAPVDMNEAAPPDEWSGDRGVGALYFSQQAVNKLLPAAGIAVPAAMGLPERLKEVQQLMNAGDERARRIYETIGTYLGYSAAHYADFYNFRHLLILGRVTTGAGGDIILSRAGEVTAAAFPELAARINMQLPDEKSRRVGQAVAAASLPKR